MLLLTLPIISCALAPSPFRVPLSGLTVTNADALWALDQYQSAPVSGVTPESIDTTFCRAGGSQKSPKLLFLHGADSNALEFRHVMRALTNDDGVECISLDWWSGGFTDRAPITAELVKQPTPPRPWTLVNKHIHAFWQQQLDAEPLILVGTPLAFRLLAVPPQLSLPGPRPDLRPDYAEWFQDGAEFGSEAKPRLR